MHQTLGPVPPNGPATARPLPSQHYSFLQEMFYSPHSVDLPSTGGSLSVAASGKKAEAAASALVDADADLEERLKNLRRD